MPYISEADLRALRVIASFTLDDEIIPEDEDSEMAGERYEMTIDDAFDTAFGAVTIVRDVVKAIDKS